MIFSWSKPHLYRDDGWWLCRIGRHVLGASLRDPIEAYRTAVRTWWRLRAA